MTFKPGNNANPNGRPKKAVDPRSEIVLEFCKKNAKTIQKMYKIVLNKAVKEKEPWALKLAMDMLCPKPGTFAPVEKTTNNQLNVQINPMLKDLSAADQASLWEVISNARKRKPALVDVSEEKE